MCCNVHTRVIISVIYAEVGTVCLANIVIQSTGSVVVSATVNTYSFDVIIIELLFLILYKLKSPYCSLKSLLETFCIFS